MRAVFILLGIILALLLVLLFWYLSQSVEPEFDPEPEFELNAPTYTRPVRRVYAFTPHFDFTVFRPRARTSLVEPSEQSESESEFSEPSESEQSESSDFSDFSDSWDDTFEDIPDRIVILGGELNGIQQHLINIVRNTEQVEPAAPTQQARDRQTQTADEFFQELNDHNDEPQNVHNSQIRKALTARLLRIIELNGGMHESYEVGGLQIPHEQYIQAKLHHTSQEIINRSRQYLNGMVLLEAITQEEAELRLAKVNLVLVKISQGYDLVMTDGIPYKENLILVHVWDRINHADNFGNREQLQIALIDNLIDAVEERPTALLAMDNIINTMLGGAHQHAGISTTHHTVCINGRMGRVLTSFVLLDADPAIAAPEMDEKELANEAYSKASVILDRELDTYKVKLPENKRTIQDIYIADEDTLSQRELLVLRAFEDHVKETIAEELRRDYDGVLPYEQVTAIITKAHAGV